MRKGFRDIFKNLAGRLLRFKPSRRHYSIFLFLGLLTYSAWYWTRPAAELQIIEVPSGISAREVATILTARGIIHYPVWFELQARLRGTTIQAGEYVLNSHMSVGDILVRLSQGEVCQHRFTIVDGTRFSQIKTQLSSHPHVSSILPLLNKQELSIYLGLPGQDLEGWFLPETYCFPKGTQDLHVLKRAHEAMKRTLADAWEHRDPTIPLDNSYQALILASIVEKETSDPAEYSIIAGVFYARLLKGMRLQADPTVIYGLQDAFTGNLKKQHLRQDTPYNTYMHSGLPPTPIAVPSAAALQAVLHPAKTKALYFVAAPGGKHVFSETLAEHNKAVAAYQLRQGN